MSININNKKILGINSLGRIGKLFLWHQLIERYFDGIVINVGREVGKKLEDIITVIESDSTYGDLSQFLYGRSGKKVEIKLLDSDKNILLEIDGFPVKILNTQRNPKDIAWDNENVSIVVDCSGQFSDPSVGLNSSKGDLRGHLEAGAKKVILSAPYKIKNSANGVPEDVVMMVYGINHLDFLPEKHNIISAASCTTTALAHMMKPILESDKISQILTATMSTIHAATNTQSVLDSMPKTGASDLRKNRSILNNVILSTTGAAKALVNVLPQIQEIGFMADSIRIPTNTVSLISLNMSFSPTFDANGNANVIDKAYLNNLFKQAANGEQKDMLEFSMRQNVSADLIGKRAAVIIEGNETDAKTANLKIDSSILSSIGSTKTNVSIPVTQAKIFAWYDNEYGSYVNMLSKLTQYVYSKL